MVAEYLNGEKHWMSLHNMSLDEVSNWLDVYRTSSGAEFMSQSKMEYSDHPSVQGTWHPHVHSDPRAPPPASPVLCCLSLATWSHQPVTHSYNSHHLVNNNHLHSEFVTF